MTTLSLGATTPIYAFREEVLYRVGFRQQVQLDLSQVSIEEWLAGMCKVVCEALGTTALESIEHTPPCDGVMLVTVRHEARPVGSRARGRRGGKKHRRSAVPA